jgi:hypothetical protein
VVLLLKPNSSTDVRGGGATTLYVLELLTPFVLKLLTPFVLKLLTPFVVDLPGRGGRSGDRSCIIDCLTGSDGLDGISGVFNRFGGSD